MDPDGSPVQVTHRLKMPTTIIPGDTHYFAINAVVTVVLQLLCFFIAYAFQFDKITDLAGSANFILIDLLTLCAAGYYYPRQILVCVLVGVSKAYLAGYLFTRVLKRGHDARFDEMRSNFYAFLGFWVFQMLWAWGVSLPVMFINSDASNPPLGSVDWGGLALFILGLFLEVVGDLQKDAFRSDPRNKGGFMCSGLWSWSRHPNFCGEILMWWAIFIIGSPIFSSSTDTWGWVTVLSPLLTMALLLFLSGMPTAEGDNQKRFLRNPDVKAMYIKYRQRTSPLIPLPPFVYSSLPMIIKRTLFFEYSIYETDWSYSGEDLPSGQHATDHAEGPSAPLTQRRSHESYR